MDEWELQQTNSNQTEVNARSSFFGIIVQHCPFARKFKDLNSLGQVNYNFSKLLIMSGIAGFETHLKHAKLSSQFDFDHKNN